MSQTPPAFDFDEIPLDQRADLAHALRVILQWVAQGNPDDPRYAAHLGRKCVAALWVVSPDYFAGRSLAAIAKRRGIACTRAGLSKSSADFSRRFAIRGGGQKVPSSNRKKTKESFNNQ